MNMWDRVNVPPVVLVVEDDWMIRDNMVRALTHAGCIVLEAEDALDAISYLRGIRPVDLLFTDIKLRGAGTGWDVAEAYRVVRPDIPVIYTSGQSSDPRRRVDGSLFFDKPYVDGDVLQACLRLIGRDGIAASGVTWRHSDRAGEET